MAINRIRIEAEDADLDRLRGHLKWLSGEIAAAFDKQGCGVWYGQELFERSSDLGDALLYKGRVILHPDITSQVGWDESVDGKDLQVVPNGGFDRVGVSNTG